MRTCRTGIYTPNHPKSSFLLAIAILNLMRKCILLVLLFASAALLAYVKREELILEYSTLRQPCGIFFTDQPNLWSQAQKDGVLKACDIYKKTSMWTRFFTPLYLTLVNGNGGAYTTRDSITFLMAKVQDEEEFYSVATHELAHVIDIRSGWLSKKFSWLTLTDWKCEDINNLYTCTNLCKQFPNKAFYCSYVDRETLPSRFGSIYYNPEQTDVNVNPSEDFAESSRYFLNANDALALTSKSRCAYFRRLYRKLIDDPCFDCNPTTICKQ